MTPLAMMAVAMTDQLSPAWAVWGPSTLALSVSQWHTHRQVQVRGKLIQCEEPFLSQKKKIGYRIRYRVLEGPAAEVECAPQ